jgi:hypothetical protein
MVRWCTSKFNIQILLRSARTVFMCFVFIWEQTATCAMLRSSIAHSIICTWLFRGKMHADWFNGIEILQGRWQHEEEVGYCYPSGLGKTLCTWNIYVPLVTKGLTDMYGSAAALKESSTNYWNCQLVDIRPSFLTYESRVFWIFDYLFFKYQV